MKRSHDIHRPNPGIIEELQTLMENEQVRVLEMDLSADETDVTHYHPSETVYFVKGGKLKMRLPDGGAMEWTYPMVT